MTTGKKGHKNGRSRKTDIFESFQTAGGNAAGSARVGTRASSARPAEDNNPFEKRQFVPKTTGPTSDDLAILLGGRRVIEKNDNKNKKISDKHHTKVVSSSKSEQHIDPFSKSARVISAPVDTPHWRDNPFISSAADVGYRATKTSLHYTGTAIGLVGNLAGHYTAALMRDFVLPASGQASRYIGKGLLTACRSTLKGLDSLSPRAKAGGIAVTAVAAAILLSSAPTDKQEKLPNATAPVAVVAQQLAVEKPERLQQIEKHYGDLSAYSTVIVKANNKSQILSIVGLKQNDSSGKTRLQQALEEVYGDARNYRIIVGFVDDTGALQSAEAVKQGSLISDRRLFAAPEPEQEQEDVQIARGKKHKNGRNTPPIKGTDSEGQIIPVEHEFNGHLVPEEIDAALIYASGSTDPRNYLVLKNFGAIESGFNPAAFNSDSKACGLMQILSRSTLLELIYKYGERHGYDDLVTLVSQKKNSDGRVYYTLKKDSYAKKIIDACEDAVFSSTMAAEYLKQNQEYVSKNIDRKLTPVEKYMTHFMGAGGATTFLNAYDNKSTKRQSAKQLLVRAGAITSDGVRKNYNVFHDKDGKARTIEGVYKYFEDKFIEKDPLAKDRSYASLKAVAISLNKYEP